MSTAAAGGPRVLLIWEHGRNLGHLVRLSSIAESAKARGATLLWVLPPAHLADARIARVGGQRYALPKAALRGADLIAGQSARLHSFADVLLALGFSDPVAVEHGVAQWLRLFDAVRPDVVLCDYSPVGQLAACLARIPAVQITNGFDAPPMDFPAFESSVRGPYIDQKRAKAIERISETVRHVGRRHNAESLDLEKWMEWPTRISDCIPEIDPYGERAEFRYVGPFVDRASAATPQWPGGSTPNPKRVFAYLRGNEQTIDAVLQAVVDVGAVTCCVWPQAPDVLLRKYRHTQVNLMRHPIDLDAVLDSCDAVVNYGSSSVLCSTLLAGKPQLMIPTDAEKLMFARCVERQSAGIAWHGSAAGILLAMDRLLNEEAFGSVSRAIAGRYPKTSLVDAKAAATELLVGCSSAKFSDLGTARTSSCTEKGLSQAG